MSIPLPCLSTPNPFPRATTYNKVRVPLIYPLWECTRLPILLGPETEVKRITSEIKTQSRRANFVSTEQEVRENQIAYIFKRVIFFKIPSILKSAASWIFEPCYLKTSLRLLLLSPMWNYPRSYCTNSKWKQQLALLCVIATVLAR